MTNPAAATLMGQWLKHGPIDLATAQALTRGYDSQQRREAWLHYQRHTAPLQEGLTGKIDPTEELMGWLSSMKSPADFAGFEFMYTREIQVEAYRSLPPETIARIKPLITAYKANPDAYLGDSDATA